MMIIELRILAIWVTTLFALEGNKWFEKFGYKV